MPPPAHAVVAIVLSVHDTGDNHRIARLLTASHGRVHALARSARSSAKRFAGALESGNKVEAMLRKGKTELWHLDSALLQDGRLHIRNDLGRIALATYVSELVGALSRADHEEPQLFGLLDMALSILDAAAGCPTDAFRVGLEVKALHFAGLLPNLDRCLECHRLFPADEPAVFRVGSGGFVHSACAEGQPVSTEWMAAVRGALHRPLRDSVDATLPEGPDYAFCDLVEAHAGRPLRTRKVLHELLHPGAVVPPEAP